MFVCVDHQIPQEHQIGDHPGSSAPGFILVEDGILAPMKAGFDPPMVPDFLIILSGGPVLRRHAGHEVPVFPCGIRLGDVPAPLPDQSTCPGKAAGAWIYLNDPQFTLYDSAVSGLGVGAKRGADFVNFLAVLWREG